MKVIVYENYGPPEVLELMEVEKPTPKDNEVLIKVMASSVTSGDVNIRGFVFVPRGFKIIARLMFGLTKPRNKILGFEFSGEIDETGKNVTLFKKGDQVFGIDGHGIGAYAEYKCTKEDGAIVTKPSKMTFEQAASFPNGALTAHFFLHEKGKIKKGQNVLINGASGSVGAAAVQIAKYYGAKVTAVCSSKNIELVTSLGADKVIDYTKENFIDNGENYDIILDTVGNLPILKSKNSLTRDGIILMVAAGFPQFFQSLWLSITSSKKAIGGGGLAMEKKESLQFLKELYEAGKIKSVVDRTYPLEQTAEAHKYVDTGHKKGNVVIAINSKIKNILID